MGWCIHRTVESSSLKQTLKIFIFMEEKTLNPFDFFAANQETYEEAIKKSAEESQSFSRVKHFRIDSPGTYTVRILPIAPTLVNGEYKLDRKGYRCV